jgi:hypothetical protein
MFSFAELEWMKKGEAGNVESNYSRQWPVNVNSIHGGHLIVHHRVVIYGAYSRSGALLYSKPIYQSASAVANLAVTVLIAASLRVHAAQEAKGFICIS